MLVEDLRVLLLLQCISVANPLKFLGRVTICKEVLTGQLLDRGQSIHWASGRVSPRGNPISTLAPEI